MSTFVIIALLAGITGLLLIFMRVWRRQSTERVVNSVGQASHMTDLFILASIPRYPLWERWGEELPAENNQGLGQPLQILHSNVLWSIHPSGNTRLLITSPERGEGKSFVAANLAVVMAQQGARVLLVDAGQARRKLHKWFLLDDGVGLAELTMELSRSDALSEEELEQLVDKYIKPTRVDNLFLLTSGHGPISSQPGTPATAQTQLIENFDAVILDGPSLEEMGNLWKLPFWEDVMLVTMIGRTRLQALRDAGRRLDAARIRTIGMIVNCVAEEATAGEPATTVHAAAWSFSPQTYVDESESENRAAPALADSAGEGAAALSPAESDAADPSFAHAGDAEAGVLEMPEIYLEEAVGPDTTMMGPRKGEGSRYESVLEELRLGLTGLQLQLIEFQARNARWEQKISDLEGRLLLSQALLSEERQAMMNEVEGVQLELDARQQEIARLKGVTAEYRRILAHKETLLAKYDDDLMAAQALIQVQRERIEFYRSSANVPERAPEADFRAGTDRDISAD